MIIFILNSILLYIKNFENYFLAALLSGIIKEIIVLNSKTGHC